jgi:hypothetical protein
LEGRKEPVADKKASCLWEFIYLFELQWILIVMGGSKTFSGSWEFEKFLSKSIPLASLLQLNN